MIEKEVAELRRHLKPDRCSITRLRGCCVTQQREIVSEIDQSLALISDAERSELLALLKKTLSGALNRNLVDIEFSTPQVMEGEHHKLLTRLRNSALADDEAVSELFSKIIDTVVMETGYLILLAYDKYDVPSSAKDDADLDSTDVYSYIICAICPIKLTKAALSYDSLDNQFRNLSPNGVVSPPELGFLFPAFDDRCANIYNALHYTRSTIALNDAFIDSVFGVASPMPATEQKEVFAELLSTAVEEHCDLEVVESVHQQLSNMITEHKESHEREPLRITKKTVSGILSDCGVPEERLQSFEQGYDDSFGEGSELDPGVIVDVKRFELSTPDVSIKVNPERTDLVETRLINGIKYIMIRASDGVEVNGVPININE